MRILLPFPQYREGGGGIITFIRNFSAEAADQGHDVTIVSTLKHDEAEDSLEGSVRVVRLPMAESRFLRRIRDYPRFGAIVRKALARGSVGKPDVILGVSLGALAGIGGPLAYRSASGPLVWELRMWERIWNEGFAHANPLKKLGIRFDFWLQRRLERRCIDAAKALLCQSQAIAKGFQDEYGVRAPAHTPCTGVDTKRFAPRRNDVLRKSLGVKGPLLLFTGGFSVPKGGPVMERALHRILKEHPDATLIIVGPESYKMELDKQHEARVLHVGPVPYAELPGYYDAADVFVYPSVYNEGFPNALLEAMASGLPIVTTEITGIGEYLKKSDALIVPQYDPEAFAGAVNKVLSDPALAKRLGANARKASLRFTWETVTSGILTFLKKQFTPGTRR